MDPYRPHLLRYRRVHNLAGRQAEVVSRRQLYAIGITRWEIKAHVRARRWQAIGDQSVCLYTGPLTDEAWQWAAVFQGGPRAHLDGASALIASGLKRFELPRIRVSVPRGARVRRSARFDIRQTRRWSPHLVAETGVPRTVPPVAAIRAALWAKSDKQAALLLTMTVQQGLADPEELAEAALQVRRDRRRRLIHDLLLDLLGGVQSLGELDFARECRRRGLPRPSRQVLRKVGANRYYLDVCWDDWHVVVEIDGIHHSWAENLVADALRQNAIALGSDKVLRLPLLGFRVQREDFFAQIEAALHAAGWRRSAA